MKPKMLNMPYPRDHNVKFWLDEIDRLSGLGYLVKIRAGYYQLYDLQIERRDKEQDYTYDLGKWAVYDNEMNFFEVSYNTLSDAIQAVIEAQGM